MAGHPVAGQILNPTVDMFDNLPTLLCMNASISVVVVGGVIWRTLAATLLSAASASTDPIQKIKYEKISANILRVISSWAGYIFFFCIGSVIKSLVAVAKTQTQLFLYYRPFFLWPLPLHIYHYESTV